MFDIERVKAEWNNFTKDDLLGFKQEVLLSFLPYELVKPFLKDGVGEQDWQPQTLDQQTVVKEMGEYMIFAWKKALDHRGISASRSVQKMEAWLWLLEDAELLTFMDNDSNYAQYGVPILYTICAKYEFPIPKDFRIEQMRKGLACVEGCELGCG